MNPPASVRRLKVSCVVTFCLTIPGLIISSIAGNNEGWVISIGLVGALSAIVLIVVTLVTSTQRIVEFSQADAEMIEQRVQLLVREGANEDDVRALVRASVQLGRGL